MPQKVNIAPVANTKKHGSGVCNMMIPIDLEKEFGHRWRIELDEAAAGRRGDPWMFLIPCRHGHLYAAGPDLIGAATNRAGAIVRKLREIPGVTVVADGTDGCNAVFSREALRHVARVMKPRSLRKLSKSHAAALALGRLVKKSHCQSEIVIAVDPIGGNLATDTHAAERLSTGSSFSSNRRNVI